MSARERRELVRERVARALRALRAALRRRGPDLRLVERGLRRRVEPSSRHPVHPLGAASPAVALELGCGAGTYVRLLAGLGHRARRARLLRAQPAARRRGRPGRKGPLLAGEAYGLPFRACSVRPRRLHRRSPGARRARARARGDPARPAPRGSGPDRGAEQPRARRPRSPGACPGARTAAARGDLRPRASRDLAPRRRVSSSSGARPSACPRAARRASGASCAPRGWSGWWKRSRLLPGPWRTRSGSWAGCRSRRHDRAPRARPFPARDERVQHAKPQHRVLPASHGPGSGRRHLPQASPAGTDLRDPRRYHSLPDPPDALEGWPALRRRARHDAPVCRADPGGRPRGSRPGPPRALAGAERPARASGWVDASASGSCTKPVRSGRTPRWITAPPTRDPCAIE